MLASASVSDCRQQRQQLVSIYDVPTPSIADVDLFQRTFARLFESCAPSRLSKADTSCLTESSLNDNLAASRPTLHHVAGETTTASSTHKPAAYSDLFASLEIARQLQNSFFFKNSKLKKDPPSSPLPSLPQPIPSTSESSPIQLSHESEDTCLQNKEDGQAVEESQANDSSLLVDPEVLVDDWNGIVENAIDQHGWYYVAAPSLNIQMRLKKPRRATPSPPSGIQFREIHFTSHSRTQTSPPLSATPTSGSSTHKVLATSPTSLRPEFVVDADEAVAEVESLISNAVLSMQKIIPPSHSHAPSGLPSATSYGFASSRAPPGQQSFSSVGTSTTTATTTSDSTVSLRSSTASVDPIANHSGSSKASKSKSRFRLSSKPRAQSDSSTPNLADKGGENSRANSESIYSSLASHSSRAHHSHLAPFGDKPNSPYYVLTSMGVKLVTPGKEDTETSSPTALNAPRKDSASSTGSSSSGKWFGRKSKSNSQGGGSRH